MKDALIYKIIKNRDKILEIARKHGVENVRVFGSVSRKQETASSDIDLLVDIVTKPDGSIGNYISFALETKKLFKNRKVEVCTPETLHPRFKEKVLANCVSIMEEHPEEIDHTQKDERDYVVNIEKAKDAIKNFWNLISLGKDRFLNDRITQSSICREMQIAIEEIVRSIPNEIKFKIKDVDWNDIKEFRNFIVHHYDNLVWETMWISSQEKIKEVECACERVLEVLGETQ